MSGAFLKQNAELQEWGWKVMSQTETLPGNEKGCELFLALELGSRSQKVKYPLGANQRQSGLS